MKRLLTSGSLIMTLGWALSHSVSAQIAALAPEPQEYMMRHSQGYLGVDIGEIKPDRAVALKLKDAHGAEVLAVDHDAPAAKAGLKAHDVLLEINGEMIEGPGQLRHILHEMAAGQNAAFLVSRDGNPLNVTVQLADREVLQQQAWSQHFSVPQPAASAPPQPGPQPASGESFLGHRSVAGSGFLGTLVPSSLYIGADVNPVRAQLADYFGVKSGTGLLVENVDDQSPASRAGLKAGDVILKVNSVPMVSRNDWLKAMHTYRGQIVQVMIVRDKEEQVVAMSAGTPKKGR